MLWDASQIRELQHNSLFSELDEGQLTQLLETAKRYPLKNSATLFSQGNNADHFYWLKSGLIKLYRLSPSGEEKIIEIIHPGQTFAEAIMFMGKQGSFPVSAQMIEAGEVWAFSSQTFLDILNSSTNTCFRVMAKMSQRLHQLINDIDRLTLQTATDRVINYLLQNKHATKELVLLLTSKQTLASQLSVKPETLSRTFSRLSKQGLITIEGNQIQLLDIKALKEKVVI